MTDKTHLTKEDVLKILKDAKENGIEANFDNKIIVDELIRVIIMHKKAIFLE